MIDLSLLPAPDVIEVVDFEAILAARKLTFVSYYPAEEQATVTAELALESDPRNKMLQENAYREVLLRQRLNEVGVANMLAHSTGADLEGLASFFEVQRLVLDPGDADARPPVLPTYELDADLRYRTQMALEGFSTAGPEGAYRFHTLSASGEVRDVAIDSPTPGQVRLAILSRTGDGTPSAELLATVDKALGNKNVRPLTDQVLTVSAEVVPYQVVARLEMLDGPSRAPVLDASLKAVRAYVYDSNLVNPRLGVDITLSALYAALHQPGVKRVVLIEPSADVFCAPNQAGFCTDIDVTLAEADG